MILCVCRGVSEREIVEAIRAGACSLADVAGRCAGAGSRCGACQPFIAEHLSTQIPADGAAQS